VADQTAGAREGAGTFLDHDNYSVIVGDGRRPLTRTEYALLSLLASRPGRIFTYENIADALTPYGDAGNGDSVRSHVKRLRKKLAGASHKIETRYGFGYCLEQRV
jgi:DNA-binding response OmpR family regulator